MSEKLARSIESAKGLWLAECYNFYFALNLDREVMMAIRVD